MSARVKIPFTLGCDPEVFMADVNNQLKASCGLIGGSKDHPQPIPALGQGFAVMEDNVAVEFNTPPASNAREFVDYVQRALKVIGDGVNAGLGYHIVNISAASFPDSELKEPAAKEFGCDPDFNAWTGRKNPKPKAADANLRSCGGHIHIGFDKTQLDGLQLIKNMDMFAGVPSVLMDMEGDKRRPLYGKRGAYREKPYGFEYRTLSNFWIFHPKLCDWAYNQTMRAVEATATKFPVDDYKDAIEQAIDGNDRAIAAWLCKEANIDVIHV